MNGGMETAMLTDSLTQSIGVGTVWTCLPLLVGMISLYEGVPGAGKSFFLVKDKLLAALKSGRRCYVRLDGFFIDRTAALGGFSEDELLKQVTLLDEFDILRLQEVVEPGSFVVIDEAQNFFRGMTKLDPRLLRWLESHRHYGVEIVVLCQEWGQITSAVHRLVEITYKFRRLWALGIKRFVIDVRGNPSDTKNIRTMGPYVYDSRVYSFYDSYAHKGLVEAPRSVSILRSPLMWAVAAGVCFLVWFFGARSFFKPPVAVAVESKNVPVAVAGVSPIVVPGAVVSSVALPSAHFVGDLAPVLPSRRVLGSGGPQGGPYYYLVEGMEGFRTAAQLSKLWAIPVLESDSDDLPTLYGEGVSYGSFAPFKIPPLDGVLFIGGLRVLKGGE